MEKQRDDLPQNPNHVADILLTTFDRKNKTKTKTTTRLFSVCLFQNFLVNHRRSRKTAITGTQEQGRAWTVPQEMGKEQLQAQPLHTAAPGFPE